VCRLSQIPRYAHVAPANLLSAALPDVHYVWLSRENKVAQAVSHWRAIQTGIWHVTGGSAPVPVKTPEYDFHAIDHLVRESGDHDAAWRAYFSDHGIEPFRVAYEELADAYEQTVSQLLAFIGVSASALPIPRPRTAKQADTLSDEWVRRYLDAVRS
jgi:LPS sulfotransferase NodH